MTSDQQHSTKQHKLLNWTSETSGISLSLSDMLSMTSHRSHRSGRTTGSINNTNKIYRTESKDVVFERTDRAKSKWAFYLKLRTRHGTVCSDQVFGCVGSARKMAVGRALARNTVCAETEWEYDGRRAGVARQIYEAGLIDGSAAWHRDCGRSTHAI